MGIIFIISLVLFPRPLIYYFIERFSGDSKETIRIKWKKDGFRKNIRVMTLVWGLALMLEAALKVVLVYTISVETFLFISEFITIGVIGLTILWQVKYIKRIKSKIVLNK